MNGLPEKIRAYVGLLNGIMIEIEEQLRKNGKLHHLHYLIESVRLINIFMFFLFILVLTHKV